MSRWISLRLRGLTAAGLGLHVGSRGRRRPVDRFAARFANIDALGELVERWANRLTLEDAIGRADASSVAVAPCYDLGTTLADDTLWRNGALLASGHEGDAITVPGLAYAVREVAS